MLKTLRSALFAVSITLICLSAFGRQKEGKVTPFKYGIIDPAHFDLKLSGTDSAASAIAIFDIGKGYFQYTQDKTSYVVERHTRYLIINKQGYDYANLELQTYRANGEATFVSQMEGATYNLENGKIVVSKISKDAKFTEKQDKNYSIKKFALANVKEGCIVEFKYTIKTDFIFRLRPWSFQRPIPTLYSTYTLAIPNEFKYKVNSKGYEKITSETLKGTDEVLYRYSAVNVPGLRKENFTTTMNDYVTQVSFELASINNDYGTSTDYTSSWPKIAKRLKEEETFGGFINKSAFTKTLLQVILKGATDPDSIVTKVFEYVKNNIKWNKEDEFYASVPNPKTILEKKVGNTADINLCLLILLRAAKIEVSPVLMSTRDNGAHPGTPLITGFNSVIVEAVIGEKHLLLDATDKNHCVDMIGYNNLNHEGLCLDLANETTKWISTERKKSSSKVFNYLLKLDEANKLVGRLFITSTDYEAMKVRNKYLSATNQAEFLKDYKGDKPGLVLKNYEILNLNNPYEPLSEAMDVEIEDNVEEAGDLAYFTPLLYEKTKENPFLLEDRKFPVDFAYPVEEIYRITIELPKNYKVEKAPKNEKLVLPNQDATFSFVFSQIDNKIGLISRICINKSIFSPEEYFDLKELFKNIVRKQAEQVVIKKS
ncbi:MAG: transglutaminase domain-containing protein [Pedobacter sp.]